MARNKQTARKSPQALVPRQLYAYAEESSSSDSETEVLAKKARSSNANDDGTKEKTGTTNLREYVPRDGLDALRATCSSNRDFIDEHMQGKCLRKIKSASASYEDGEPDPTQRCNNWRHSHLWGEDKEPGYNIIVVALVDGNEVKKEETFAEDEAKEAAKYLAALLRNADLQEISLVNGKDFIKAFKREVAPLQLTVHGTLQFESVDSLSHTNAANIIGCFNTINVLHMRPQDSAGKINDEFLHACVQHNVARLYLPNEATPGVTDDGIVDFCVGSDVAGECLQSSMKPSMRKLHVRTPKITNHFLDRLAKAHSESIFKNRLMFKTWGLFPGNSRKLRDEFCTAVKAHQSQVTTASGSGNWVLDFVAGDMRMKVCYNIEGREISVMRALQTDEDFFKQNNNRFY